MRGLKPLLPASQSLAWAPASRWPLHKGRRPGRSTWRPPRAMESPFRKHSHGCATHESECDVPVPGVKTTPVNASPVRPLLAGLRGADTGGAPGLAAEPRRSRRGRARRMSWMARGGRRRAARPGTSARCSAACGGRCRACSRWATCRPCGCARCASPRPTSPSWSSRSPARPASGSERWPCAPAGARMRGHSVEAGAGAVRKLSRGAPGLQLLCAGLAGPARRRGCGPSWSAASSRAAGTSGPARLRPRGQNAEARGDVLRQGVAETFVVARLAVRLYSYLGLGWRWTFMLARLIVYAILLMPGFAQVRRPPFCGRRTGRPPRLPPCAQPQGSGPGKRRAAGARRRQALFRSACRSL